MIRRTKGEAMSGHRTCWRRVSLAVVTIGAFAVLVPAAIAAPPPPLGGVTVGTTGEVLGPSVTTTLSGTCNPGNSTITFHSSGAAVGPYPGTFTADGSFTLGPPTNPTDASTRTLVDFTESFTITSLTGQVTGTKTATPPQAVDDFCVTVPGGFLAGANSARTTYSAEISPPTGGRYRDTGQSFTSVSGGNEPPYQPFGNFGEDFFSSNGVVPLAPTSKDECKDGGWQNYPQFQNQGQCVKYVNEHGG